VIECFLVLAHSDCPGYRYVKWVVMAALRSTCGQYIFALWFLLSLFFFSFLA